MLKALSVTGYMGMIGALLGLLATRSLFSSSALVISVQVAAFLLFLWARVTFGRRSFHVVADPTEGGLAAGLHELARASGVGIRIDRSAVLWFEPGVRVCRELGADVWSTLASGTLLASFPADTAEEAVAALAQRGYPVAAIGIAVAGSGVVDGEGDSIVWPDRDEVDRLLSEDRRESPPVAG